MEKELINLNIDRIGALIGKKGVDKKRIEKEYECKLNINSENGDVEINCEDSLNLFNVSTLLNAVSYGFSVEDALELKNDDNVLDILNVKERMKTHSNYKFILGRIIGRDGSVKKTICEITKCKMIIQEEYVSVIGTYFNVQLIHKALDMLISGAAYKTIYSFLEKNHQNE